MDNDGISFGNNLKIFREADTFIAHCQLSISIGVRNGTIN